MFGPTVFSYIWRRRHNNGNIASRQYFDKTNHPPGNNRKVGCKDCHEIITLGRNLYVISTSFDSVLEYDTLKENISRGLLIRKKDGKRHEFSKVESKSLRHLNDRIYYSLCNRIIHRKIHEKDIVIHSGKRERLVRFLVALRDHKVIISSWLT